MWTAALHSSASTRWTSASENRDSFASSCNSRGCKRTDKYAALPGPARHPAAYLGQVHVGLFEKLGVIVGHQADDIIKHPVLFVHGDGEVYLLHHREESTRTNTHFSPVWSFRLKVADRHGRQPLIRLHQPLCLLVFSILLHLLSPADVQICDLLLGHTLDRQLQTAQQRILVSFKTGSLGLLPSTR